MAVCSEYLTYVTEALVLEDTMKNYERRDSTGWSDFLVFSSLILFIILSSVYDSTSLWYLTPYISLLRHFSGYIFRALEPVEAENWGIFLIHWVHSLDILFTHSLSERVK